MQLLKDHSIFSHLLKFESWPPTATSSSSDFEEDDDQQLLTYITTGTPAQKMQAFTALYNRYHLDVWRLIRSKVDSEACAKDIFCDVWIVALEKLPSFVWQGKPIKAWLLSVSDRKTKEYFRLLQQESSISLEATRDLAISYIEARITLDEPNDEPETATVTPPSVEREADRLLNQMLTRLSKQERQIISLIYYRNLNSTQIGHKLNLKPVTVRANHMRALKKLRKLLATS